MGQKKYNNANKLHNNYLNNFKLFNKFNTKWDIMFNFCINYFQQNNYSKSIINIVKTIQSNKSFCLIIFVLASWFWSNLVLNFVYYFMLCDSLIISLLVLQNNCVGINSRRLAKNIILMILTSMNIIGGMMTLLMVSFIYMEYSKFVGRLIFKLIKFFIKIIGNIFPPIYLLYPDIKLFNFEDPDMTICDNSNNSKKKNIKLFKPSSSDYSTSSSSDYSASSSSDYSASSSSDSESEQIVKNKKDKKNNKDKKINNNTIKTNKIKKTKPSSSFPTISTIKYNVFKDIKLND